jgi:hypothetical protein
MEMASLWKDLEEDLVSFSPGALSKISSTTVAELEWKPKEARKE